MTGESLSVDTVVVGGGITGLYACLKLREARPGQSLALFEASERLGGRIETVDMDGFLAEYGPMRFERLAQPLLMQLVSRLGLETCDFHPYLADTGRQALFDLASDEGRPATGHWMNALELLTLGILRVLDQSGGDPNDPKDPKHWSWWGSLDEGYYHHLRQEAVLDGEPLRDTGFWNALSRVLSHRALNHIIHYGTFYHLIHHNPNAAEWIIFWLRGLHPRDALVGIRQGTEALVRALAATLRGHAEVPVPLIMNHRLDALSPQGDGLLLKFSRPDGTAAQVLARRVVLALPWSPLKRLRRCFPQPIAGLTDAVIPIPLLKCFFVTRDPWWGPDTPPQTRAFGVPARELHYYHRVGPDGPRGMAMVYGERPTMDFWRHMVEREPHQGAEIMGDRRLLGYYLKYLSKNPGVMGPIEGNPEAEAITMYGIRDWSREPFEAGCHVWKPGVRVGAAIEALSAFSLPGCREKNVHICGEAYSDFQGFIEGGLRTASKVVEKILGS